MRFLWSIHLFPPKHNCGSEYVAYHVSKFLISRGHEVRVVLHQAKMHGIDVPYEYNGVRVQGPTSSHADALDMYRWADVLLTHLDYTRHTVNVGRLIKKPVVSFIHSHYTYEPNPIANAKDGNFVVYNSEWVKDVLNYPWPSTILHPPCPAEHYRVCENPVNNEAITLISLNENKGGYILRRVAMAMPDKKFIGVVGSYDDGGLQDKIIESIKRDCPNVEIVPNSPDILSVYKRTRILLMPSRYESWGRTATEAMINGIPVICTPTPGLKENCSYAGLYIPDRGPLEINKETGAVLSHDGDSYDIEPIINHIRAYDGEQNYRQMSHLCRDRAAELQPDYELNEVEKLLIYAQQNPGHKRIDTGVRNNDGTGVAA